MDRVAYLGMQGAIQTARAQQIHLNNLANADTPSFKADMAKIQPQRLQSEGFASRAWAVSKGSATDLSMGSVRSTGRALDVVLPAGYWMAVQNNVDNMSAAKYTRRADLQVDAEGYLANGAGNRVLDEQGNALLVTHAQTIRVSEEGTVSMVPMGASRDESTIVGRLQLIKPNPADLSKSLDGLFVLTEEALVPIDDATQRPALQVGFLEGSNVNPVIELMDLLRLSRHHEINLKFVEAARHQDEVSAAVLRWSY